MELKIEVMSGEELAEILSQAYQQANIAQNNIMAVNAELQRRKQEKSMQKERKPMQKEKVA